MGTFVAERSRGGRRTDDVNATGRKNLQHPENASGRRSERLKNSALEGHLDYVDLAERIGQGVTVEEDDPENDDRDP
jgi:hypothetical protein